MFTLFQVYVINIMNITEKMKRKVLDTCILFI